jgi:ABC-type Mn2+/Zn2+ transport system ATPase subunit
VAYVIQNFSLDPLDPFLCRDVVMMGRVGRMGLLKFPTGDDWGVVDGALHAVGMARFAKRPVGKLSGGEFQKILLARAMAQDPDLLLLDEPFTNLDIDARSQIQQILKEWCARRKVTVLMVSHDLSGIPPNCDRIVVMDRGHILMKGSTEEMLSSPRLSGLFPSLGDLG